MIVCEFVGTAGNVATAATAFASSNYTFVIVVVDNYKFVFVADFLDNNVYTVSFVVVVP